MRKIKKNILFKAGKFGATKSSINSSRVEYLIGMFTFAVNFGSYRHFRVMGLKGNPVT